MINDYKVIDKFMPRISFMKDYGKYMMSVSDVKTEYIKTTKDLERYADVYTVWYRNSNKELVDCFDDDAIPIKLSEAYEYAYSNFNLFRYDMLEKGIKSDVEVLIATDTKINKSIIVDGNKRLSSLYSIMQVNRNVAEKILKESRTLSGKKVVSVLTLSSPKTRFFFSTDFMRINSEE